MNTLSYFLSLQLRLSKHQSLSLLHLPKTLLFHFSTHQSSSSSWLSSPGNPLIKWPSPPPPPPPPAEPLNPSLPLNPNPNSQSDSFRTISDILANPAIATGADLDSALDHTGIEPDPTLLQALFDHLNSSPKLLFALFTWAEKRPGFRSSAALFNSVINALGKLRDFDSAWKLIKDRLAGNGGSVSDVTVDTFVILIRRFNRAGRTQCAIESFEYTWGLDLVQDPDVQMKLFEILLDSLCKEGHVGVASGYFYHRRERELGWLPSIRIYNILLNGWFRSKNVKCAEAVFQEMKKDNVKPNVVTYGTIVDGLCGVQQIERAIDLIAEMRSGGIEPNAVVFNPIIDALAEEGRLHEALDMMERFLVCEFGPTISTYNSLVKGFCKAGDLDGASKILKMMINRSVVPTATTYNYFFRYFSKCGKIDEGMNLYNKMIESGYTPDRLTYHLLLKMLCEEERVDLALQVSKEMRTRGFDMDINTSTMLVHLLCKMYRFEEAVVEFEDMIRRGVVPHYLTFQRMTDELAKQGKIAMAQKLKNLMSSVPHSTKLPSSYRRNINAERTRRTSIIQKAEAMSSILKTCNNPRKLVKLRRSSGSRMNQNLGVQHLKETRNEDSLTTAQKDSITLA